jgi:hypothetical protein
MLTNGGSSKSRKYSNCSRARHGREAADDDELWAWFESPQGKAALAPHLDENDKIIPD